MGLMKRIATARTFDPALTGQSPERAAMRAIARAVLPQKLAKPAAQKPPRKKK